ncbi:MAG: glycoside hydrolase family 13 protein [Aquiluna sp.]
MAVHVMSDALIHHDGSSLYVPEQRPKLGQKIKVRIRIHDSFGDVKQVLIRQSDSGEAFVGEKLKVFAKRHGWSWYEGSITLHNPQVHYRFFIELKGNESYWLNAKGLHELDQSDRFDFRVNTFNSVPKWATGAVLYEIFPDTFSRSEHADSRETPSWALPKKWGDKVIPKGPGVSTQFFGGDLKGIEEKLDHLKTLGVTIVYLTPFFESRSNHRYDAASFDYVDPVLGGDEALSSLVAKAHALGMKVMGDLTANHTGSSHEWFVAAHKNPQAKESQYYYFTENNQKYDAWWGFPTLPKLNWNSSELRKLFIKGKNSVVGKWLRPPFGLDGWRIDVANMAGLIREDDLNQEIASEIKKTMQEVSEETFLVGEFTADASTRVIGDNYQSAMTYSNFTRPIWRWLWNPKEKREEKQIGVGRQGITATQMIELHKEFASTFPWHVRLHNLNALDTHDTGRFKTFAIPSSQRVAATLQFTLPGIPMLFAGDEFGLDGTTGEESRTPIPWNGERKSDTSMISFYTDLARLRKKHRALVDGSVRFIYSSKEALMFTRENKTETILVCVSRGRDKKIELPKHTVAFPERAENLLGGGKLKVTSGKFAYEAKALDTQIWRLPSPVR